MSEFSDYWLAALDDPDRIWPEDLLTEAEWMRGWFDRQVVQGRATYAEQHLVHPAFGGTAEESA